ncbi:MAG: hypothetical protein ACR2L5_01495 [Candidatus Actinomarinaceae bacterium]
MKVSKSQLKILIEGYLNEEVGIGDYEFDPYKFFKITKQVSDYEGVDENIKEFLRLVGYVCVFEILKTPGYDSARMDGIDTVQVTSGKRTGAAQLNAWLDKIAAGETKKETIALYSPGKDPFMTPETKENAIIAYDRLVAKIKEMNLESDPAKLKGSSEIKEIGQWIDSNPVSAHLAGMSIDLRARSGKAKHVMAALRYIADNNLAEFYYQEEPKPHHIHIGPLYPGQAAWLTSSGLNKLYEYDELVDSKMDTEDPTPYEHMP